MSSIGKEITSKAIGLVKDHGKGFDENNTWTIKFLADVKVVYIITYIYVTVVNLISSTARSEVLNDEDCDNLYNVSSGHTNVPVKFINNAVLWSCRDESLTNYYYKFLYWMLIIVLITTLISFAVTKLMALCILCCSSEHVLTKLWHLAIISELIEKIKRDNEQDVVATDQQPDTADQQTGGTDGVIADQQTGRTSGDVIAGQQQTVDITIEQTDTTVDQHTDTAIAQPGVDADTISQISPQQDTSHVTGNTGTNLRACEGGITDDGKKLGVHFNLKNEEFCKRLLHQDIPPEQMSKCKWQRSAIAIPIILLVLLVVAMGISFLSYDLHPLGCLLVPDEKDINYNSTIKSVKVKFPDELQDFQIAAGFAAAFLALVYLLMAWAFYLCSKSISLNLLTQAAKEHIIKELEN